jgi:RimJ/RimL family protein N-acetyltransferase
MLPILIPFAPAHFATLAGWFGCEADVVSWGGPFLDFPIRADQLQAMIGESAGARPERLCWMAAVDRMLIGHAQLVFDSRNGSARLARVAIAPGMRGRGLAAPLVREVVARAFAFDAIERVELNVFVRNTPAIRTYQRLGFVAEGVRRASTRVGNERWDTAIMAMLRAEWEGSSFCSPYPEPEVNQDDAQGS